MTGVSFIPEDIYVECAPFSSFLSYFVVIGLFATRFPAPRDSVIIVVVCCPIENIHREQKLIDVISTTFMLRVSFSPIPECVEADYWN